MLLPFYEAHAGKEGYALAGVLEYCQEDGVVFGGNRGTQRGMYLGFREFLQRRKIGKVGLRSVVPLGFGKVENVGLGGEPVEIMAEEFAIGRKELKIEKIGRRNLGWLRDGAGSSHAVGGHVQLGFARELFRTRNIVKFGDNSQSRLGLLRPVDDGDGAVIIRKLHMDRLERDFRAEVPASGMQVVAVEMPDQAGPGVVKHPLDDAGGSVFIAAVSLKHGALAFVGHGL